MALSSSVSPLQVWKLHLPRSIGGSVEGVSPLQVGKLRETLDGYLKVSPLQVGKLPSECGTRGSIRPGLTPTGGEATEALITGRSRLTPSGGEATIDDRSARRG